MSGCGIAPAVSHVLTLVAAAPGGLAPALVSRVADALRDAGGEPGATADPLSEGEAADLPFARLDAAAADAAARAALAGHAVDAIAQALGPHRRKRLLVADMDSTVVASETLDEVAALAGVGARVAEITRRSMNGDLDFAAALRERVAMLRGLPLGVLREVWEATRPTPGAEPVFDRAAKRDALRDLAARLGVPDDATLAVGDGANDLDMLRAAGLGVAYRAKPVVAREARARLDHADLRALLYAQGYRRAEIAPDGDPARPLAAAAAA